MTRSTLPDVTTRSPLIVVLDDDPHECTLLGTLIQDTWPRCAVQAGPPTAALLRDLTRPDGLRPDLLIVEQDMPGCMGLDILRTVRASPGGQTLPVVILSADEDPRGAAAAHHAGASAYHVRPTAPAAYRALLADLLRTFLPDRAD
ncbi:response regulator [Deinococcus soli (ex Cha et al. 2016)]|uniref:Response regulatory domain-containing protein n=1 Tax=Deinococcus soli (ex Cha et al. 2016) TaxID=1309411 RepID=A0A0F7JJZ8_9DEIO|nr:response regulator [Deinococcus soli (ex Cha et al. 2016)]AKH16032.1 hypothetical protein SY84_02075 [Deinococcus soli (ex Cha et al. 2016)]